MAWPHSSNLAMRACGSLGRLSGRPRASMIRPISPPLISSPGLVCTCLPGSPVPMRKPGPGFTRQRGALLGPQRDHLDAAVGHLDLEVARLARVLDGDFDGQRAPVARGRRGRHAAGLRGEACAATVLCRGGRQQPAARRAQRHDAGAQPEQAVAVEQVGGGAPGGPAPARRAPASTACCRGRVRASRRPSPVGSSASSRISAAWPTRGAFASRPPVPISRS